MAKRFTDTKKWEDPWFRQLSVEEKCFWFFLVDNCDEAGFWKIDLEVANFYIKSNLELKKTLEKINKDKLRVVNLGEKLHIKDFPEFQYGSFRTSKHPFHKKLVKIIDNNGYPIDRVCNTPQDKDKVKDKEQVKDKDSNIQKVVNFFFELKGWSSKSKKELNAVYARYVRPAKNLLELTEQNVDMAKDKLQIIKNWADSAEIDWSIETVFKRWFDLDVLPQEKKKRPRIEGCPAYQKGTEWFVIQPNGEHKKWIGSLDKIEYA